jgi:hypothetical protein
VARMKAYRDGSFPELMATTRQVRSMTEHGAHEHQRVRRADATRHTTGPVQKTVTVLADGGRCREGE